MSISLERLEMEIESVIAHGENMRRLPQNQRLRHLKAMLEAIERLEAAHGYYKRNPPWGEKQHMEVLRIRREKALQRQIQEFFG